MTTLNTKTSIVDYLKSKGLDSSLANRTKLGTQYGIDYSKTTDNYTTQNIALLSKLQGTGNVVTSSITTPNNGVGAGGTPIPNYSTIVTPADANTAINGGQTADVASVTADGTPPTKTSFKNATDIMAGIKSATAPKTPAPTAPDYQGVLTGFRAEYGVNALETQLTDLQAQARDIEAAFQVQKNSETGKPVAMNVIEGRVSEEQKAAMEKLTVINNSIATVNDQLKTKYNTIDSLMKTKEIDYTTAATLYDKEMETNISMFNAAKGIEEANKTEAERSQDNARSTAQITLNAIIATNQTWDKLSTTEQNNLTKMGVQSGLGGDFFSTVLAVSAGKGILTTVPSADKAEATIVHKDGTTKNISTGLTPTPKSTTTTNADGTPKVPTTAVQKTLLQKFLTTGIAPNGNKMGNPRGADGFTDPGVYIAAFTNWTGTVKDFLNYFPVEKNVNPASYGLLPDAIKPKTSSKRTI